MTVRIRASSTRGDLVSSPDGVFGRDTGSYERVSASGLDLVDDSRALIGFDYDRDGDRDVLVTCVNGPVHLLENVSSSRGNWLDVTVRQGEGQNRFGIGVTIHATVGKRTLRRDILAGGSYLSGRPSEVHFGLGAATQVDSIRIEWTDGTETTLKDVTANQRLTVVAPGLNGSALRAGKTVHRPRNNDRDLTNAPKP
jgi:hypothetical protein